MRDGRVADELTSEHIPTGSVKRRSGNSLATMDLNLLQAWFDALLRTRGNA